ncbi:DUF1800 domain-containing protein [Sphingobacteriales bacterium UPWRP_1]|nr:hypothetical protein BVG80_18495 [Sphingobacteriales bacterium TSM_CSM]PSJ73381.1 DUF1800 domain-containing protein [Sphingobacteriales bacterium UPWRP_1]
MLTTNCVTGGIGAYVPSVAKPWNKRRVEHLYRRMGFGATPDQVTAALLLSPSALIDQIVDQAATLPASPTPVWASYTLNPLSGYSSTDNADDEMRDHLREWRRQLLTDMEVNGFRDKLVLFWHNHFVTGWSTYQCSKYLYQYHLTLQQYALGNLKDFVYEIGKTPAMLIFLDGALSTKNNPNENYARELYELFTLGEGNGYTQTDIIETSRALTGWRASPGTCVDAYFDPTRFDNLSKTIFGQTGNWNYDDVHDILFQQRSSEVAHHICRKIYKHFVYNVPDENIVSALATTLQNNNFELVPVFKQLFKSDHFFDDAFVGAAIKSPADYFVGLLHQLKINYTTTILDYVANGCGLLGQVLFEPVDVAGWPGHHAWITEDTLTRRWDLVSDYLSAGVDTVTKDNWVQLAKDLTNDSNDPSVVAAAIADYLLPNGLSDPEMYNTATQVFKSDIPENYFEDYSWNLDWPEAPDQINALLGYLIRLPEFQLA